jgi:hypothetical protein
MAEATNDSKTVGWARAILTTAVIAVVGVALLVYAPNAVLTRVHSINRSGRVGVATAVFVVGIGVLARGLRWLQSRGMI